MQYTDYVHSYLADSSETWCTFAARAGVSRAALYKFLRSKNAPRIDTLEKIMRAAGFSLVVIPATPTTPPAAGEESQAAPKETRDA